MSDFLKNDTVARAFFYALGSMAIVAILLWGGLAVAGMNVESHLRWFGICFLPPLLLLRYFVKRKDALVTTRTIILILFVSFIVFIFFLIRTNAIEL